MSAVAQFLKDEQDITDIQVDTALQVVVEFNITTQLFPVTVKSTTDQFSVFVQYRAAGVTTGNVVGREEANRHISVR